MHPAVRDPTGACIEEQNCDFERITLCAFNQTSQDPATQEAVDFLVCMDEAKGGIFHPLKALTAGKTCAASASLDWSSMESCYNGAQGDAVLKAASVIWNKQFPGRATVPHTFVNQADTQADYSDIKKALCAAGSKAAVCSSESKYVQSAI